MSSIEADFDRLAILDDEGWTANNHYHNFLLNHVPENCENAYGSTDYTENSNCVICGLNFIPARYAIREISRLATKGTN